jgi:hypothetical protein
MILSKQGCQKIKIYSNWNDIKYLKKIKQVSVKIKNRYNNTIKTR